MDSQPAQQPRFPIHQITANHLGEGAFQLASSVLELVSRIINLPPKRVVQKLSATPAMAILPRHIAVAFSALYLAVSTFAQSTTTVDVFTVAVSNAKNGLNFDPPTVQAPVGSIIEFVFKHNSHSIVRTSFEDPCNPSYSGAGNFYSGVISDITDTSRNNFYVHVNDTAPIYYYCAVAEHCQKGMVGIVNPLASDKSKDLAAFKKAAAKATTTDRPQAVTPWYKSSLGAPVGSGSGSSSSSSSSSASSTTSGSSTSTASSSTMTTSATAAASPSGNVATNNVPLSIAGFVAGVLGFLVVG